MRNLNDTIRYSIHDNGKMLGPDNHPTELSAKKNKLAHLAELCHFGTVRTLVRRLSKVTYPCD